MGTLLLGLVSAAAASTLFNVGLALQALESRTIDAEHSLRLSLLARLLRRRRWLLGTLVALLGFPFHTAALLLAPLTVVQPALAAGLLLLLAIGVRILGEHIGWRERTSVLALVAGVTGLALTSPGRTTVQAEAQTLALTLGGLALIALIPYAIASLRGRHWARGHLPSLSAGTAYALSGITLKLMTDRLSAGDGVGAICWLAATGAAGGLGILSEMTALQHQPATHVGPIVFVVPVIIPVLLAPAIVGESWTSTPLGGLPLAASLGTVCTAAAILAASSSVSALVEPKAAQHGEGDQTNSQPSGP